ncbi:RING zinc finger protein, putative [Plasmodium malariae]|uniref:RING zinc finger protein, putative n=1 Tax=Plasmodium malariae TaxID=5858 RepID=A0A1D3PA38_PLAMA|nr:RING zinc finger protein, putative [Plasmodium malariae]SCN12106.1 RING zinc finger protein, putative [Plasmodium malariae]
MVVSRRGESKHMLFLNSVNSKKKLNITEKKNILEKVHILPIRKCVSNFDELYNKLNLLISDRHVLYEGFIISIKKEEHIYNLDKTNQNEKELGYINTVHEEELNKESEAKGTIMETNNQGIFVNIEKRKSNNMQMIVQEEKEKTKILNDSQICLYNHKKKKEYSNSNNDVEYVVVNCVPSKGILSHDTLIYTDGKYADNLSKIQILIIKDRNYKKYEKKVKKRFFSLKKYLFKKSNYIFNEAISLIPFYFDCFSKKYKTNKQHENNMSIQNKDENVLQEKKKNLVLEQIFLTYLYPYFKKNKNKLFYCGKLFIINNFSFLVVKVDSDVKVGFIDDRTEIVLNADSYDHYNNVHIVPLYDTLPTTYNYDLFMDYIKPYIERNYLSVFSIYETFFYKGVQFKIMGVAPVDVKYGKGRISCNTFIYIDGSIKPTFFDVISKESVTYIKCLPFEYKPYAILNILQHLDTDSLLRLFPSANNSLQDDNNNNDSNSSNEDCNGECNGDCNRNNNRNSNCNINCNINCNNNWNNNWNNNKREKNVLKNLTKHKYIFNRLGKNNNDNKSEAGNVDSMDKGDAKDGNIIDGSSGNGSTNCNIKISKKKGACALRSNLINEQCAVCFEYFQDYDKCIKLTCLHTYHWKCVKSWFKFNLTCPCCRHTIDI